jgi:serine/threonine protein kinase
MKNELTALEDLSHPHIVRIYELLEDGQNVYVISELISDGDLQVFIDEKKRSRQIFKESEVQKMAI